MPDESPISRPVGRGYNDDPVPNTTPSEDKPIASCNHCGYSVPWDAIGEALLEQHFKDKHLDKI